MISKRLLWMNVSLGAVAGAGIALCVARGLWLSALAFVVMALTNLVWPVMYRRQFVHGWMMGRLAMMDALPQALARGMTPMEWMTAEMERDGFHMVPVVEEDDDG